MEIELADPDPVRPPGCESRFVAAIETSRFPPSVRGMTALQSALRCGFRPAAAGLIVLFGAAATAAGWVDWFVVGGWLLLRIGWVLAYGLAGVLLITAAARAVPRRRPGRRVAPRLRWWVIAAAIVVAGVAWGATTWLLREANQATDPAAARVEAIKIGLSIGAGTGGVFALLLAVRRQLHQELSSTASELDAAERRATELYTKAADQLGSDKAPVRLAGIYALERVAQNNPEQRQTIVNVLCAYLRMPYQLPGDPPGADDHSIAVHRERTQEREVRRTAQRVLTDHLRPGPHKMADVAFWNDISLDLRGAILIDFDLAEGVVYAAQFAEAICIGFTNFESTTFNFEANFRSVTFTGPTAFRSANFVIMSDFSAATFDNLSSFESAFFGIADFESATFNDTTIFRSATFSGPRHSQGTFRYTNFDSVTFARGVPADLAPYVSPAEHS